jgi:hypothetical protein
MISVWSPILSKSLNSHRRQNYMRSTLVGHTVVLRNGQPNVDIYQEVREEGELSHLLISETYILTSSMELLSGRRN